MNEEHETAKAHSTRLIPPPIPFKGAPNPKSAEVSEKELSPTFKKIINDHIHISNKKVNELRKPVHNLIRNVTRMKSE